MIINKWVFVCSLLSSSILLSTHLPQTGCLTGSNPAAADQVSCSLVPEGSRPDPSRTELTFELVQHVAPPRRGQSPRLLLQLTLQLLQHLLQDGSSQESEPKHLYPNGSASVSDPNSQIRIPKPERFFHRLWLNTQTDTHRWRTRTPDNLRFCSEPLRKN